MAKVETEHMVNRVAEDDGQFESISVCPIVVLGPYSAKSELIGSWQWFLGRMLGGNPASAVGKRFGTSWTFATSLSPKVLMIESDSARMLIVSTERDRRVGRN
ncbi:MAG: hypothetical protein CM1200mP9_10590 [Gammaproteobacteria bacterium]|nr:MAG: hypothetical protein CM1200mP9_10590 [Gammaproteobacteria bacterium]